MNEQEFVAQQFQTAFSDMQDAEFVLYGLGKNTKAVLEQTQGFSFAGLMDSQNMGREYWNLKVLSPSEVLEINPKIVIIAREPIVPVIYERIAYLQEEYGLQIYNFKGELLGQSQWTYKNRGLPYWKLSKEDLQKEINAHDYISFDIFDTLLMRRVLEPADVFRIVERVLNEKGYEGNCFFERRTQAEQSLSGHPTLPQIYEAMESLYGISADTSDEWRRLEMQVEDTVIVPRRQMTELFQYALRQGKNVWLISDMYFSKEEMEHFLKKWKIEGYNGLLVSCGCRAGKDDGKLYEIYQKKTDGKNYLHIGDNRRSDGENAGRYGIDTFLLYSAYEMWMASAMQTTLSHADTLEGRLILGNLIWKCCEDPFAFHKGRGVLIIDMPEKLGYIFLGALYCEFIEWLLEETRKAGIGQLLLPSRDGYLISRMLEQEETVPFRAVYFKASRRAVSVAAAEKEEDILFLAERNFQGTFGELLKRRFGIQSRENDAWENRVLNDVPSKEIQEHVLSYREEILQSAGCERREYLAYLKSMGITDSEVFGKQAVFDFVAGGTVQYFMQKLIGAPLKGFYFATMNHPNENYHLENSISPAYGNIQPYHVENETGRHYLFLETIMVDGNPALECIKEGRFIYEEASGSDFSQVKKVQDGIIAFQRDMKEIKRLVPGWKAEKTFADMVFGRLFTESCEVEGWIKKGFVNDDTLDGIHAYAVWNS